MVKIEFAIYQTEPNAEIKKKKQPSSAYDVDGRVRCQLRDGLEDRFSINLL